MVNATLYGPAESFRTQKVLIAAQFANKKLDVKSNLPPNKFPLGLTPAYEDGKVELFGADAIAKYIAQDHGHYVPKLPSLDQWLWWADSELLPNVLAYTLPSLSYAHVDQDSLEHAKKELLAQLQHFDKYLIHHTFLVGERLSVADVSVALNLIVAFENVLDFKTRKSIVNVTRWFNLIVNQSAVKAVIGNVKLADEVAQFNVELYKKNVPTSKKEDKKPHKNEKPVKKEAPPPQPKPAAEEPQEEQVVEVKFVDPFLQFPSGNLNLDAFKRCYSNEDTVSVAIPYFWEKFDPEHYSIWYCEYKYPEDLALVFMSCNLISGMYQRLEKMRKHAFASVCLFGKDSDSTISGIWIWRGHKLAFELCPDWQVDYESYEWKKLDPAAEETKKTVNAYFAWEGFNNPRPFNQGKIFK